MLFTLRRLILFGISLIILQRCSGKKNFILSGRKTRFSSVIVKVSPWINHCYLQMQHEIRLESYFQLVHWTERSSRGIFINKNNQIFIADRTNHSIKIWNDGENSPSKTIFGQFLSPYSLFVDENNEIFYW